MPTIPELVLNLAFIGLAVSAVSLLPTLYRATFGQAKSRRSLRPLSPPELSQPDLHYSPPAARFRLKAGERWPVRVG